MMKYKRRIIRELFERFPYKKLIETGQFKDDLEIKKSLVRVIRRSLFCREGIFGYHLCWRIRINFITKIAKVDYFPLAPSRKNRIHIVIKENER